MGSYIFWRAIYVINQNKQDFRRLFHGTSQGGPLRGRGRAAEAGLVEMFGFASGGGALVFSFYLVSMFFV